MSVIPTPYEDLLAEVMAEGMPIEALLAMGFLDHLVAPEDLAAKAEGLAETAAGLAPLAVRGMKRTILELSRGALDAEAARARVRDCFASADHAEGWGAPESISGDEPTSITHPVPGL